MTFCDKILSVLEFIKILRVEPYVFLMIFQFGLKMTPDNQMIQDKICVQWYNTTPSYCHGLPSLNETDSDLGHYKSRILSDSAQFGFYKTCIVFVPQIIWALFIGAWVDRFRRARKLILFTFSICVFVENLFSIYLTISWDTSVYLNLVLQIPALLLVGCGSGPALVTTHYITSTTSPDLLPMRFMVYQLCATLAIPVGRSLGGYILVQEPIFKSTGQIRNYTMCHIIALVFEGMAFLWIVFMIDEKVAQKQEKKINEIWTTKGNAQDTMNENKADNSEMTKDKHPIKMLFDLENARVMIRTLFKKRPNKARGQLLLLIFSMGLIAGESAGMHHVHSQFIQKVYLWTPDWISYMSSIGMLIHSLGTLLIITIASKLLNVGNISLALFGYVLFLTCSIMRGLWLDTMAYYVTMVIGAFDGCATICSKSHLTKIVDRDEIGKIMSFLMALDHVTPIIFSSIFIKVFRLTIDTYPGTVFLVLSSLVFIPIVTTIWIQFCTERPLVEKQNNLGEVDIRRESLHDQVQITHF